LRAQIELHIRVYWETVPALFAHAAPFAIRLHEAPIDPETAAFTDGTLDRGKSGFDGFDGWVWHELCVLCGGLESA
jgi:hypothetical protein